MKNFYYLFCIVFAFNFMNAQTDLAGNKAKLKEFKTSYETDYATYKTDSLKFEKLKSELNLSVDESKIKALKALGEKLKEAQLKLNVTLKKATTYLDYIELENGKIEDSDDEELKELKVYFDSKKILNEELLKDKKEEKPAEPKVMLQFGDDKVISEKEVFSRNEEFNEVIKEVLKSKSKTQLGNFSIPPDGQKIKIFKDGYNDHVYFKSVEIHAKHGLIQDIKITVLDEKNNTLLFSNNKPISLLRYSKIASINNMFYRYTISNNNESVVDNNLSNYRLTLSDVLMYTNKPGENFVPDEIKEKYPKLSKDSIPDNINGSVTYVLNQDSNLENVLNLRTYTDFLGLFGDSPNGIIQIEGKADFYLIPFNLTNTHWYFLNKVSPFINYARIEENDRNINIVGDSIVNRLDVLQKSYVNMGLDLDLISTKFTKESPVSASLYATARYNIADVIDADSTKVNYKSLALGGGLKLSINRFNNFGLTLKSEMTKLDTNEFNDLSFVNNPGDFWVFRNEAEIFYHPTGKENQSIFLRLNTFNNASSGNDEAFFQLQFGYRFSVGLNKVKAK